jgi:hypothetical protein
MSSETACAALNGRLARLVGMNRPAVRSKRQDSRNYRKRGTSLVIYRTQVLKISAAGSKPTIRYHHTEAFSDPTTTGSARKAARCQPGLHLRDRNTHSRLVNLRYETRVNTHPAVRNSAPKDTKPKGFPL